MGAAASSGVGGDVESGDGQREPLQQQQQHQQEVHFLLGGNAAAVDSAVARRTTARNSFPEYPNPPGATAAVPASAAASSAAAAAADADDVVGLSSAFFPPSQKGLRTMDLQSLFQLPKLALASAVWPDEASSSGPLAAAEKVLLQQQQQQGGFLDQIPASPACVSRYKKLLLRDRLSALEEKEDEGRRGVQGWGLITAAATEDGNAHRDGWGVRKPEEEFDCVSLAGLTMRETGIASDPSLASLSRCVGFYSAVHKLKLQLQKQLHQTERKMKLQAGRNRERDARHRSRSGGDSSSSHGGETETGEGVETAKGASGKRRSGQGERTHSRQEQQQRQARQQQQGGVASALVDGALVAVTDDVVDASFAAPAAAHQELLQLQCLCVQLQEDIQVLNRACGELHALLQGVWQAAKMPLNHKINKIEFRRLWCCGADNDQQQVQLADKIFELCSRSANGLEGHTPGNRSSASSSRNSVCSCGCGAGGSERLAFADLLYQLPPRALECMWYRAELRRKRKQQYRYFWI
ncbi:hypothetical protein, conserved [Eimeria brunetti]|uniref:Uncharacterized protein n=1 Tax=Eimeria brunetti TaxID=51314 RepID=U6LQQ7_9EIME|nr:hypothetical protein, conserved [Eimeria brunetti]